MHNYPFRTEIALLMEEQVPIPTASLLAAFI